MTLGASLCAIPILSSWNVHLSLPVEEDTLSISGMVDMPRVADDLNCLIYLCIYYILLVTLLHNDNNNNIHDQKRLV